MHTLRTLSLPFLSSLLLLLAACGGGGTAGGSFGPAGAAPVSVAGVVIERNGETTDLAGIGVLLVETGELALSDDRGAFAFATAQPGTITLRVDDHGSTSGRDGPDDSEDDSEDELADDDADDREESSDDSIRVQGVSEGESVRLRLRIVDGEIVEVRTSRSDRDEREAEIRMVRALTNDDPDLEGEVELESRVDEEKFETEVEHATPGRELELFVLDVDGVEESQGVRAVDAFGEAEWEFDTGDGQRLPFGVATVAELAEYEVEVRDALTGVVLLTATLSELPAGAPPADDDSTDGTDDESDESTDDERLRGRARLVPVERGLEGYVEVRSRPDEGRERFQMEVERLAPGRVVEFLIEDPDVSGVFLVLGRLAAGADGEAELELDTNDGDVLPAGVETAGDLAGLAVEVRDPSSGALLLQGVVPAPVVED